MVSGRSGKSVEKSDGMRKAIFLREKPFRWFQKPEGAEAGNILEIRSDVCARAESKWKPVVHTKTLVPDKVKVRYVEDLNSVQAQAVYSDGSVCAKKIKWDLPDTEKSGYGNCEITGTVYEEGYKFPLAVGYGDPVLFFWEGSWYFIATNDNEEDIALYARKADSVAELLRRKLLRQLFWISMRKRISCRHSGHRNFMS